VTGALHGPEEFRVRIDCDQAAVAQDDIHRDELVRYESVATLKPSVTTSEAGTQIAHTFACSRHCLSRLAIEAPFTTTMVQGIQHMLTCLFSCRPKRVREVLGDNPTANGGRLPIFGDRDAVQLAHMDFNAMGHFPQRGD